MGLMDNIKKSQEMAQQAAAQAAGAAQGAAAGAAGAGGDMMAKMQATNRPTAQQGLDGEGTITAVEPTGQVNMGGAKEFKITVEASIGGDPYTATALQNLRAESESAYAVGSKFKIKVDPEDKTNILLMGAA